MGTEPELYAQVSAISGDDALFGGMSSDLIFGIDATDLPFDEASAIREPEQTGGATDAPQKPPVPASGGVGLGTGGLY